MMGQALRLILENQSGQKVRTFRWETDSVSVIYRNDNHRVEAHTDLSTLDEDKTPYILLKHINRSGLSANGVSIPNVGRIRLASDHDVLSPVYELPEEDENQFPFAFKRAATAHIALLFLMMGLFYLIQPAEKMPEMQTVTVMKQELPKKEVEKKQTIQMAQNKIEKVKITKKMKVVSRPVPKITKVPKVVKNTRTNNRIKPVSQHTVLSKTAHQTVKNIGALGALGGLKNGTKGFQGLDANSMKNIRGAGVGSGGGGVGSGMSGGIRTVLPGNGLIAGSAGGGSRGEGAGGYGTVGNGGGRAGYGHVKLVGSAAGITMPVDEEAFVQGGLDKDQIAAVINKNMAQITYCYEQGLQYKPGLVGRVGVKFVINGSGIVSRAGVSHSSLNYSKVENCIVTRMKSWKFPTPVGRVNVTVDYPFDLRRVTQN